MDDKKLRQLRILEALQNNTINNQEAAVCLGISLRQVQRKKKAYLKDGIQSLFHKNLGRSPVNKVSDSIRSEILTLYREQYQNYNYSHITDILQDEHSMDVSRSTVDRILRQSGITSPKHKKRRKAHRSRPRKLFEGEMAQADASPFDWLCNGEKYYLHGFIDDATGKPLALFLDMQETGAGYIECMRQMNANGTLPQSVYTDGRTVFVSTRKEPTLDEQLRGIPAPKTQFVRALEDIGIIHIHAHSPQAKGRIERLWETLQDRLVKDLKRMGIRTIEQANEYLKEHYTEYYQDRFSVRAEKEGLAFVDSVTPERFEILFSSRLFRKIDAGMSVSVKNKKYVFESEDIKKEAIHPRMSVELAVNGQGECIALLKQGRMIKLKPVDPITSIAKKSENVLKEEVAKEKAKHDTPWRKGLPPINYNNAHLFR